MACLTAKPQAQLQTTQRHLTLDLQPGVVVINYSEVCRLLTVRAVHQMLKVVLTFFTATGGSIGERLRIDPAGNAIFQKSGGAYLQLKDASAVRGAINVGTSDGLIFTTGASFTQRMALDSSGVLLMGAPGGNSTGIIQGSSGAGGTNQPGTDLQLKGGSGGGTGGSKIKFFTAPGGSSGTAESAATQVAQFTEAGTFDLGTTVNVFGGADRYGYNFYGNGQV